MKLTLRYIILLLSMMVFCQAGFAASTSGNKKVQNHFQFQIAEYETTRQGGQKINLYVRYKFKKDLEYSAYPDYRSMRESASDFLEPSEALPVNVFWEVIAANIGEELLKNYPIEAISVQLQVFGNEDGAIYEPGFHGAIYTKGNIQPLNALPPVLELNKAST